MRELPTLPDTRAWRSPLLGALLVWALFLLQILVQGYTCWRVDHQTQIPLLWLIENPDLYPRDWFMQEYAHVRLRLLHVMLMHGAGKLLGPGGGIFLLYALFSMLSITAWLFISRHLYKSILPGIVAAGLAVFYHDKVLGGNYVAEPTLIPRLEAWALAWWGLYAVLTRRWPLAGLALGVATVFQPAVGGYAAAALVVWGLLQRNRRDALGAVIMAGVFAAVAVPYGMWLSDSLGGTAQINDAEQIRLAAYIRHPHHMLPLTWLEKWGVFFPLAAVALLTARRSQDSCPAVREASGLAWIIAAGLALATVPILFGSARMVLLQPYRIAVLMYLLLYLTAAPRVAGLLATPDWAARGRAFFLMLGGLYWQIAVPVLCLEVIIIVGEISQRPIRRRVWIFLILLVAVFVTTALPDSDDMRRPVLWSVGLTVLAHVLGRWRVFTNPPVLMRHALLFGGIAGLVWILSFWVLPYPRWMEDIEDEDVREFSADMCEEYQVNPIPVYALERIADWAREHTPQDALFLTPPQRDKAGWRLWSRRSAFFTVKFFPYQSDGMREWKNRYLTVYGATTGPEGERDALRETAMQDKGAGGLADAYADLPAEEILEIVARYGINYVVSSAEYDHPRLQERYSDWSRNRSEPHEGDMLFLYEVTSADTVPAQPETMQ